MVLRGTISRLWSAQDLIGARVATAIERASILGIRSRVFDNVPTLQHNTDIDHGYTRLLSYNQPERSRTRNAEVSRKPYAALSSVLGTICLLKIILLRVMNRPSIRFQLLPRVPS